jgi:hypothetical protein
MLSLTAVSPDTVTAARVCACLSCKRVARRTESAVLATLAFELAYDALRRVDLIRLSVHQ